LEQEEFHKEKKKRRMSCCDKFLAETWILYTRRAAGKLIQLWASPFTCSWCT